MATENADCDKVCTSPKLSRKKMRSNSGILRVVQMVLCLSAFVSVQCSPSCVQIELRRDFLVSHCTGPDVYVFRIFLAGTMLTFLTTLTFYGLFISNLTAVIRTVPWNRLIFIHTGVCILVLLSVSVLLAYDDYSSTSVFIGQVLCFLAVISYTIHFCWQIVSTPAHSMLTRLPLDRMFNARSSGQSNSEASVDSDGQRDDASDGEIATLSAVRQRASSVESTNVASARDWAVVRAGESASSSPRDSPALSSDESEDPRSWVISGSQDGEEEEEVMDRVVNVRVKRVIREDTMSTDTYTVETSSASHPPF